MEGTSCKKIVSDAGDASDAVDAGDDAMARAAPVDGSAGKQDAAIATERVEKNVEKNKEDAGTNRAPVTMTDPGAPPTDAGMPAIGTSSSAAQAEPEACENEGATRCATASGQRNRETCQNKSWAQSAPCAASEICVMGDAGAMCAAIEQLCVGNEGKAVCDAQGQLLLCNQDGTVRAQEMCMSASLCQAAIAGGKCPMCLANEDYRCTGATLERCAPDGMSFMSHMECPSAALCSPMLGMCSAAVCLPGTFTCESNVLKRCKPDSSGFDEMSAVACGAGTCDAEGGDCNMCQPGQKTCMGNNVMTCDATGQRREAAPCANNMKCIGAGQCVACTEDSDCSALTNGCKVGACEQYRCVASNAQRGTTCTTSGRPGTCDSGGQCQCTPQCDKPCGADGCSGQCPNTCGALMCVNDACVECTNSSQCDDSADGCQLGMCNPNGRCTLSSSGTDGQACRTDNMDGTCSGGRCMPNPPPPPPTQDWTTCTNPGGTCSTGPSDLCHVDALYCVRPCGDGTCPGTRSCIDGWCLILPPCPSGLREIEIDAYVPPTGKALICAEPTGI